METHLNHKQLEFLFLKLFEKTGSLDLFHKDDLF